MLYRLSKKIAKRRAVLIVGLGGLLLSAGGALVGHPRPEGRTGKFRAGEAQKLALARPHLDEGRRTRTRLDRLLMTDDCAARTPSAA